jgi:hypothetical protein
MLNALLFSAALSAQHAQHAQAQHLAAQYQQAQIVIAMAQQSRQGK